MSFKPVGYVGDGPTGRCVEIPYSDPVAMRKFNRAYLTLQDAMVDAYEQEASARMKEAIRQQRLDELHE